MNLEAHADGTVLVVRVAPRSSKSAVDGVVDGSLRIRLAAPPVDGAANKALIDLIARACGVAKSRVSILSGERSRQKRILLQGLSPAEVHERLGLDAR